MPGPIPSASRSPSNGVPPLPPRSTSAKQPAALKAAQRVASVPRPTPKPGASAAPRPAPRPAPQRPAPAPNNEPQWGPQDYRDFYESQVTLAQEQQDAGAAEAAIETLTVCWKRLQHGCHQFSTHRQYQPVWGRLRQWTEDTKNRLAIVRSGASLSAATGQTPEGAGGASGAPTPSTANELVNQANAEVYALVEACVPETKADIKWEDVIGVDEAVQRVREAIELPHILPQFFASGVLQPWRGILLWGPPGTGKTMLAQAAANSVSAKFYCVTASDIVSKYMGQGEKFIKALFRSARQQPSIIFIDEVDAILTQRSANEHEAMRRIKTQFLQEMQGFSPTHQVTVIAATNVPWEIDDAALRRLEARVWVPLPSFEARAQQFAHKLAPLPNNLTDADFDMLAKRTDGYSGSDINTIIKDAALRPAFAAWHATHVLRRSDGKFVPCTPETPGAMQCPPASQLKDVDFAMEVTIEQLLDAVNAHPPAVDAQGLVKYDNYKKRLDANKQ